MSWLQEHRGPFRLMVHRLKKSEDPRRGTHTYEWLPGEVMKADLEDEARALLADTRDRITNVDVWSVTEETFVGSFKRPILLDTTVSGGPCE